MDPLEHTLMIPVPDPGEIEGDLRLPGDAAGLVVFAHGSGSSRHSPRNRMVATRLNEAGFGTLLVDLLTSEEEAVDVRTAHLRFDVVHCCPELLRHLGGTGDGGDELDLPIPSIARSLRGRLPSFTR